MGQPVVFFEVMSHDPARAQRFYADMFGWSVTADSGMGGYGLVDTGGGEAAIGGGIGPCGAEGAPAIRFYVRVDDVDGYLTRAEQLGATRLADPVDLPNGWGRIAVFADADGNPVGLSS